MNEKRNPLLDFLYADHERVASFLSQIYEEGVPTESEKSASRSRTDTKQGKINIGPVGFDQKGDKDWKQEARLTFDPLWWNSRKLIDHVAARQSSRPDTPRLGHLSIIEGSLMAYDLSALTSLMNANAMQEFIARGISSDNQHSKNSKSPATEKRKEAEVIREFIKALPLGIGFTLISNDIPYWFSVKREFLSLYNLDVPLKFPIHISGSWKVLGIIDALPGDHVDGIMPIIEKDIDGIMPTMVLHMMQLTGATTLMFGRPQQTAGLSPLVVYREISE